MPLPFYLSIDFTTSVDPDRLRRKKARIEEDVKYFQSEFQKENGRQVQKSLESVPHITLGFDADYLKVIAREAMETDAIERAYKGLKRGENKYKIDKSFFDKHVIRHLIIDQAIDQ